MDERYIIQKYFAPLAKNDESLNLKDDVSQIDITLHKNLITGYNRYNCNVYSITPIEGSVVIFPSKIGHFTQKFTDRKGERLVIPGDIRVTLKPQNPDYHQGSTHPSQWLQL